MTLRGWRAATTDKEAWMIRHLRAMWRKKFRPAPPDGWGDWAAIGATMTTILPFALRGVKPSTDEYLAEMRKRESASRSISLQRWRDGYRTAR